MLQRLQKAAGRTASHSRSDVFGERAIIYLIRILRHFGFEVWIQGQVFRTRAFGVVLLDIDTACNS